MPCADAQRNPHGDWCFRQEGGTQIRSLEWILRLWKCGDYEHIYSTTAGAATGSLHRRGTWSVADNRVFLTVAGMLRISRPAGSPPQVHAAPVKSFQQLVFEIDAAAKTLTSVDEQSPLGPPTLTHVPDTESFAAMLTHDPPVNPHPEDVPVFPVRERAPAADGATHGYVVQCDDDDDDDDDEEYVEIEVEIDDDEEAEEATEEAGGGGEHTGADAATAATTTPTTVNGHAPTTHRDPTGPAAGSAPGMDGGAEADPTAGADRHAAESGVYSADID